MSIVLDAGALIAIERNDRGMWLVLKRAALLTESVLVPSTVLAQVWRGSARQTQLGRVLKQCVIAPFDAVAEAVGVLCGKNHTSDICDAHVAVVAARSGKALYTSDPGDLRRLLDTLGEGKPTIVTC
jgi:predicted nucleic acid-binding protein